MISLGDNPLQSQITPIFTKLVTDGAKGLEQYISAELLDESEFLAELNRLYDNIDSFINGKEHVQQLIGSDSLDLDGEQLIEHKNRVIKCAAEILLKKKIDLHVKPASMSSDFFAKVKPYAIALGCVNPDLLDLQQQHAQLLIAQQQQAQLIEQLHSSKELNSANFIERELIPLTQSYFQHLTQEAQKYNPLVSQNNDKNLSLLSVKEEHREMYNKIISKHTAIEKLLLDLTDKTANPLPSARIVQFTKSLQSTNGHLKEHRDAAWINYFKASMVFIGVVCSGVIPGIIVLLAYSTYQGKSPLFFTQSKGEQYVDDIAGSLKIGHWTKT